MSILMCQPRFYNIEYEINPWMDVNVKADNVTAAVQWRQLYETIQRCGETIHLIDPHQGLPDMVFTANGGLVVGKQAFLAQFKYKQRRGEQHYFKHWFIKAGYNVVGVDSQTVGASFEGEGDALFAGKTLFVGHGIRSDKDYFQNLATLSIEKIVYCELVDPYFYHLDTCFCPLNSKQGIWWPGAFTKASQHHMENALNLTAIPENEAKRFACNAVIIKNQVIIPSGCPETENLLQRLGFNVQHCDMSEYIKSGGACKCLTLYL